LEPANVETMSATPSSTPAPRCVKCGAPLRDVMASPGDFLHLCRCHRLRRADLADGAALLFCVVAIAAWGCL